MLRSGGFVPDHTLNNNAHALSSHSAYVFIKTSLLHFTKARTELFSVDFSHFQLFATVMSAPDIPSS